MTEQVVDDLAAALHAEWEHDGATFDELAKKHGLDRIEVRRMIFAEQIKRGGPSKDLVPVGGPAASEAVAGELIAAGAAQLPAMYRGEGPPPNAPQHVIDNWLPDSAKRLILRGKSPHTIKAYLQGMGWWTKFARANRLTILPASQNGVIRLLDYWETFPVHVGCTGQKQANGEPCTGHRPSPSAVWILYSALVWFHGLGEPPIPCEFGVKLSDAIAGYIDDIKEDGWRVTKAPRAYPDDTRLMVDTLDAMPDEPPPWWDPDAPSGEDDEDERPIWFPPARRDMLRALLLAANYTGGRASDLARYRIHDVGRFPGGLDLTLAKSKANRGKRAEEHRTIHANLAHPQYCGVVAIERWIARLAANGIYHGALFRPVHKRGVIVRAARTEDVSYQADVTGLSRALRLVAKAAWLASGKARVLDWRQYSIHSWRRNRVQQLLEEEADVYEVAIELGWSPRGAINEYRAEVKRQSATAANAKGML